MTRCGHSVWMCTHLKQKQRTISRSSNPWPYISGVGSTLARSDIGAGQPVSLISTRIAKDQDEFEGSEGRRFATRETREV